MARGFAAGLDAADFVLVALVAAAFAAVFCRVSSTHAHDGIPDRERTFFSTVFAVLVFFVVEVFAVLVALAVFAGAFFTAGAFLTVSAFFAGAAFLAGAGSTFCHDVELVDV